MEFLTFDTETQHGKAFLACTDDGKETTDTFINTKQDVIDFIHSLHAKSKIAFCYNLEYDVCALLKYFGYNAILDLYLQKSLVVDNIFIRSVPAKFFIATKYTFKKKELSYKEIIDILATKKLILEEGDSADKITYYIVEYNKKVGRGEKLIQKSFYAFDIWQFYEMSLDKASAKYLGESKAGIPKSWMSKLKTKFADPKCREKIIKYCRKDARLTYLLSEKFINMLDDCDIHPKRFYSSAYIAKNYIRSQISVPIIDNPEIINFMKPVFRGGRTEVMQRGYFKHAVLSDINSAYPKALSLLKRIYHAELTSKPDKSADYYFIDCEIDLPQNYINPVPAFFKMWKYPYGKMRVTIDNMTMDNVSKAGGKIIKIYRALNVYCDEEYPFRKIVKKMFAQRQKSDSHKYIFKMLLNAYIGKLHEKKSFIRLLEEGEKGKVLGNLHQHSKMEEDFEELIKHSCSECYSIGKVQPYCRNSVCVEYRKEYAGVKEPPTINYQGENIFATEKKLGKGTNIIYAALVTSIIRNIIYQEGVKLGDDLIAFLTDGILSKRPLKKYGKGLGEFSKKYEGDLYLLGSGMYQMADTIDEKGKRMINVKFRGFSSDKVNLRKISIKNKKRQEMKIPVLERTGLGRAVGSIQKFNDFNVLKPSRKKLNVNFDTNRIWTTPFKNYGEALQTNINSIPVEI